MSSQIVLNSYMDSIYKKDRTVLAGFYERSQHEKSFFYDKKPLIREFILPPIDVFREGEVINDTFFAGTWVDVVVSDIRVFARLLKKADYNLIKMMNSKNNLVINPSYSEVLKEVDKIKDNILKEKGREFTFSTINKAREHYINLQRKNNMEDMTHLCLINDYYNNFYRGVSSEGVFSLSSMQESYIKMAVENRSYDVEYTAIYLDTKELVDLFLRESGDMTFDRETVDLDIDRITMSIFKEYFSQQT